MDPIGFIKSCIPENSPRNRKIAGTTLVTITILGLLHASSLPSYIQRIKASAPLSIKIHLLNKDLEELVNEIKELRRATFIHSQSLSGLIGEQAAAYYYKLTQDFAKAVRLFGEGKINEADFHAILSQLQNLMGAHQSSMTKTYKTALQTTNNFEKMRSEFLGYAQRKLESFTAKQIQLTNALKTHPDNARLGSLREELARVEALKQDLIYHLDLLKKEMQLYSQTREKFEVFKRLDGDLEELMIQVQKHMRYEFFVPKEA